MTRTTTEVLSFDALICDRPSVPLELFVWLSPGFPIGGFAYSHGLEWAVESGDIHDGESLRIWLEALIQHGSLRNDSLLCAAAWRAVADTAQPGLAAVNELALALAPSAERFLETTAQGNAFHKALEQAWPCKNLSALASAAPDLAYPVALGAAAAEHGFDLEPTLAAFALAFQNNLISAAVRLGTLGQSQAVRLTASLLPLLRELARLAAHASLAELGSCAFRADIASMKHETQYSRLFRS